MIVRTTCNRDCPDACGILAEVREGKVVSIKGDPDHPVTRGFLCHRTSRFLQRQYHRDRLTRPLIRRGDRQVEIPLEEALHMAAEKLVQIRGESGPAAILNYRLGGSLGLLKEVTDYFFELFGPTAVKTGDVCSGAGEAAQAEDFGYVDSHDLHDLLKARHIVNWGRNFFVSSVHMIPVVKEARARGASLTVVDPVFTRTAQMADSHLQVRPGADWALIVAVARRLFERGLVSARAAAQCDNLEEFRRICFSLAFEELLKECDIAERDVDALAEKLADGPSAILVGWGLQRRLSGAACVRLLDALGAVSGNLGRPGGGVLFTAMRRRPFDFSFRGSQPAPRRISEPLLGQQILAAQNPPVRCIWVTCANPVVTLPDSTRVAEAFEKTEFTVAVDSHPTDTTRRATLVFPVATLLEDDDLMGSYGHHWLGISRPVVPPPPGVLTDLQLIQEIARRVGLGDELAGSARDWKLRFLQGKSPTLEELEEGARRAPFPEVLFTDGVPTPSGRVNLIHRLPDAGEVDPAWPLWLFSNSVEQSQASQWAGEPPEGHITATVHPSAAGGLENGTAARVTSSIGSLVVRLAFDERQRKDVVIIPKGGHFDRGQAVNSIIPARLTDRGEGAAYLDTRVRIEPP